MQSLILLSILMFKACCKGQHQTIIDDDKAWNSFFRGMHTAPQFPYPGTLGHVEWDAYTSGFPPSLWDTKEFSSILQLKRTVKPETKNLNPIYLWENYWRLFELFVEIEIGAKWENIDSETLWKTYITMVKETFCCPNTSTIVAQYTFGCANPREINDCCKKEKMFSSCNDIGTEVVKSWSAHSIQALKFKFYYWLCVVYADRLKLDRLEVCPDPCRFSPCDETANAVPSTCRPMPFPRQVYRDEYTCQCRQNFFFDTYSRLCLPKPLCSMNPCNSTGTVECVDLEQGFECRCKPEFTGSLCSAPANPCLQRLRPSDVSGNVACATSVGNLCEPHFGRDSFRCKCFRPYQRENDPHKLAAIFRRTEKVTQLSNSSSESLPPDNCMSKVDTCSRVSCGEADGRGRCMPSGNMLSFLCVCEKNSDGYAVFEGKHCEIAVSQWLDWSHWSACRPDCGDSCYQSRQRPCGHLAGYGYCKGSDEELRPCQPGCQPCPNRSFAYLSGVFLKETSQPLLMVIVSLFLMQLLCIAVLDWFFSPDRTQPV